MNRVLHVARLGGVAVIAALLAGSGFAEPSSLSIQARNAGSVSVYDLQILLGDDVQFQMFDFESKENFCLIAGFEHEVAGRVTRSREGRGFCNLAGRQRLIVVVQPARGKRMALFGLHDLDAGTGGYIALGPLPLPPDITGFATTRPEETIYADRDTVLMRWTYGTRMPGAGPLHEVRFVVRLAGNTRGIGTLP